MPIVIPVAIVAMGVAVIAMAMWVTWVNSPAGRRANSEAAKNLGDAVGEAKRKLSKAIDDVMKAIDETFGDSEPVAMEGCPTEEGTQVSESDSAPPTNEETSEGDAESAQEKTGQRARDNSKNEPHGDAGRRREQAERRIEELRKKLDELNRNQGSRTEKKRIRNTIRNIREAADREAKGETHGRRGKGKR